MLVAILNRAGLTPPLILGPFDTEEQIIEMCERLRIGVGFDEVVDPATFDGDRDRLWVYGTRFDYSESDEDFGPYEPAVQFAEDYGDHGDDTPRPEW